MAGNPFWAFSLDFYGRPGVAGACLALQDRCGADVNLVLFALWAGGVCGAALDAGDLQRLRAAVGPWQAGVVGPLRAVRRHLKHDAAAAALREKVKALELEAERVEQDRLLAASGLRPGQGDPATAEANLRRLLPAAAETDIRLLIAALAG
ncbi:TIGR02444 family protein [Azospirillum halopraeferens]|uniref:TIGR02444 family protein n=1 Tax=Azospirillum halopraeferens TaxID=34010 RepID=UPI0004036CFF|nr:TIGR02444 family protein [Azospirillum halopraeferens]